MEWVETTGSTLDEAKDLALDQLGIDESEAEFEVLEEPKPGLFGRTRGEARVRARVAPREPRPKAGGRQQRRRGGKRSGGTDAATDAATGADATAADASSDGADDGAADGGTAAAPKKAAPRKRKAAPAKAAPAKATRAKAAATSDEVAAESGSQPEDEAKQAPASGRGRGSKRRDAPAGGSTVSAATIADEARTYLEGLVGALGYEGVAIEADIDEDEVLVRLDGGDLGLLIGPKGQTLQALQDLVRLSTNRSVHDSDTRLHVDVSGYRQRRREALARFAVEQAQDVIDSGEELALEPMNPADRKVVHDAINDVAGVSTVSEGREGQRRVVILPD